MDPLIGRELDGRYRLVAALGEGAMGRVYRAERLDGSGLAAVKVLNEDCSEHPDLRERFEREARALFGLQHPHILDVQDYGVIDGQQPYLVMELLEGQSLDEMVDEEVLDPATGLEVGRQLLTGLAHAHAQGVLHRDLKTENVFVVRLPDGRFHAKLLDFGLVKFVDDDRWGEGRKLTVAGSVMGSPAYMSPEQGTGGQMDARSDVYSAGVVLYELLTGVWPFEAESRMEMLKAHLLEPVPALSAGREGLRARPELDALLQKAMAKDVDDRFPDAQQMLAALQAIPAPAVWLDASAAASAGAPAGSLPPPPGGAPDPAGGMPAAPAAPGASGWAGAPAAGASPVAAGAPAEGVAGAASPAGAPWSAAGPVAPAGGPGARSAGAPSPAGGSGAPWSAAGPVAPAGGPGARSAGAPSPAAAPPSAAAPSYAAGAAGAATPAGGGPPAAPVAPGAQAPMAAAVPARRKSKLPLVVLTIGVGFCVLSGLAAAVAAILL